MIEVGVVFFIRGDRKLGNFILVKGKEWAKEVQKK